MNICIRKIHSLLSLAVACCIPVALTAFAENALAEGAKNQVTTVFGLPIGGEFPKKIKACPKPGSAPYILESLCLRSKSTKAKDGSYSADVTLAEKHTPAWLSIGFADVYVEGDGKISKISILSESIDKNEMIQSISARFGSPKRISLFTVWEGEGVVLVANEMNGECCRIAVETKKSQQERIRRTQEARDRRPVTP